LFGGLRYDILAGLKRRRFFEICSVGGALDGGGGNEGDGCFKYGFLGGGLLVIFDFCRVGGVLDGGGGNEGGGCFKYGFRGGGLLDGCGGRDIVCCNLANKNDTRKSRETSR